MFLYNLPNMIW